eukprot:5503271-Prymnesium_polylepis.1
MGLLQNDRSTPGETKSPTPHQLAEMSSEATTQQERQEKINQMNSMCVMVKGKQTFLGLNRRQWIDRFLELDPTTSFDELAVGEYHIVELGRACEPGSESDLESIDSDDEKKEHEYKGNIYKGRELLDL